MSPFWTFGARSFLALWRLWMCCNCLRKDKIEHFTCVGFLSFLLLEPNQQVICSGRVSSWRIVVTVCKVSVCICLCHCDQMCKQICVHCPQKRKSCVEIVTHYTLQLSGLQYYSVILATPETVWIRSVSSKNWSSLNIGLCPFAKY